MFKKTVNALIAEYRPIVAVVNQQKQTTKLSKIWNSHNISSD